MFEPTLSIDLGASCTKIAYRSGCLPRFGRSSSVHGELLAIERSILIPSVVVKTGSADQPWICGEAAAQLRPGPGMKVFRNWKSRLFQERNDRYSTEASVAATEFFRWIRTEVENVGVELAETRVCVAMPAFQKFDEITKIISTCMALADWNSPIIHRITEPHANVVGLFSRGANVTRCNKAGRFNLNYGRMFGENSVYIRRARDYALHSRRNSRVGIAVVDIGAFTTDVAGLSYDFSDANDSGDGLSSLKQQSFAHGVINQLDEPVREILSARHGIDWSSVSVSEGELVKRALYAGNPYSLVTAKNEVVNLGDAKDRECIKGLAHAFGERAWEIARKFLGDAEFQYVYLTGGGAAIRMVHEALKERFSGSGKRLITLPPNTPVTSASPRRRWDVCDAGLERSATALGGASVVLEVSPEPQIAGQVRVPMANTTPSQRLRPHSCTCNGLNPGCARCHGTGYLP